MGLGAKAILTTVVVLALSGMWAAYTWWPASAAAPAPTRIVDEDGVGNPRAPKSPESAGEPKAAPAGKGVVRGGSTPHKRAEPRSSLTGLLLDAAGTPIVGAAVLLRDDPKTRGDRAPLWRVVMTDAEGRFEAAALPLTRVRVTYHPPGARSMERFTDLGPGANEIRLETPPGEKLRVVVVDDSGRPIEGAKIQLFDKIGSPVTLKTDAAGNAQFVLTRGMRNAIVLVDDPERKGLYMRVRVQERPEGESLPITLRNADVVTGRVVDAAGEPVAGVWIGMLEGEGEINDGVSDAAGNFKLICPRGSTVELRAEGMQFQLGRRNVDLLASGRVAEVAAGDRDVTIPLVPRALDRTLTCEVRGPQGAPMPGAKVLVHSALVRSKLAEGTADSNGLIDFEGLPAGPVLVVSFDPERTPERHLFSSPRETTITPAGQTVILRYRETAFTTGTLLDEKENPVKRCRVVLKTGGGVYLGQAWTDETGNFKVRSPADEGGPCTLTAKWKEEDGTEHEVTMGEIEPGQEGLMVTVRR